MRPSIFRDKAASWVRQKVESLGKAVATTNRAAAIHRRPLDCMELEDRTLFNATPLAAAYGGASPAGNAAASLQRAVAATPAHSVNVVLIDTNLADYNVLAQAALPGDKVWLYDGVHESANQVLSAVQNWAVSTGARVQSLSVLAHGVGGEFELGNQWISTSTLSQTAAQWRQLSQILAPGAEIDLYGCKVAAPGSTGQALLNQISQLTGAEVFANTNPTGHGDWTLNASSANGQATLAAGLRTPFDTQILDTYSGVLSTIALDSTTAAGSSGIVSSLTFSHTVGSGSNGLLIVDVVTATASTNVTSVTYGGVALTEVGSVTGGGSDEMWYLKGPTAGTANVVVTLASPDRVGAGATSYFGVDQTNPIGTTASSAGPSANPALTFASATGNLVVDSIGYTSVMSPLTAGSGQTQLWNGHTGSGTASDAFGADGYENGAASVTVQWTTSTSGNWEMFAANLNPEAGPTITAPSSGSVNENASLVFSSANSNPISVSEPAAGSATVQTTFSVSDGKLTLAGTTGLTFTAGANGTGSMTVTGTLANINADLNGLAYTPTANYHGSDTLAVAFNDLGANGGSAETANSNVTLTVNQVNQPPVNTVPTAQTFSDNTTLVFSSAGGNPISVADSDSNGNAEQVTLSVSSGTLSLSGTTGLTITGGSNGSAVMTVQGTLTNLNAALNGLTYTPPENLTGNSSATLSLISNDLGNTGVGGALTASSTVGITINHVDHAPVNTVPLSQIVVENGSLVFSSGNGNAISVADSDSGGGAEQVTLTVGSGTLSLSGTTGLTFIAGANGTATMTVQGTLANINTAINGLNYSPTANYTGTDTLHVTTDDLGNTGPGGPITVSSTVSVNVATVVNNLVVTTTSDVSDGNTSSDSALIANDGPDGFISLREAIQAADNTPGVTNISFNIAGSGVKTINLLSSLPTITSAVTLDATSQPGYSGTPLIELNGASAGAGVNALTLGSGSSGSTIRGFDIEQFNARAILITGGSANDVIQANYLGTDPTGLIAESNGSWDIDVNGAGANNLIGGTSAADRNIIAASSEGGIALDGASVSGTLVEGNYIGVGADGATQLGNSGYGGILVLSGASGNTIGGAVSGAGNVISGNTGPGIDITGSGSNSNVVAGNYIGTNAAGTSAVANGTFGVYVESGASDNTIGGSSSSSRNIISGNTQYGVYVQDSTTASNTIENNYIGTTVTGLAALSNGSWGVAVDNGATGTTITSNVISGNTTLTAFSAGVGGIYVWGSNTYIGSNLIGLGEDGTTSLPNGNSGASFTAGTYVIQTTGSTWVNFNEIANNVGNGIEVANGVDDVNIADDLIYNNTAVGININSSGNNAQVAPILSSAYANGLAGWESEVYVKGTLSAAAANSTYRIDLYADSSPDGSGYGGSRYYLGTFNVTTDGSGNAAFSAATNSYQTAGVTIAPGWAITATATDSTGNTSAFAANKTAVSGDLVVTNTSDTVNGNTASVADLIASPGADGISLREAILAADNTIVASSGPRIHFDIAGSGVQTISLTSALPAIDNSITIDGASQPGFSGSPLIQIDGAGAGAGVNGLQLTGSFVDVYNLSITDFSQDGIMISGSNDVLSGDYLGLAADGITAEANAGSGVVVTGSNNQIGPAWGAGSGNVISGNGADGVQLSGAGSTGNLVLGNYIGTNATGTAAVANVHGINLFGGATGNTIGGTATADDNVISGNSSNGILVQSAGNTIEGNYLGTNATGSAAVANQGSQIFVNGVANTVIGGAGAGNVISGGGAQGIKLISATNTTVQGNYIGVNPTGSNTVANASDGLYLSNSSNNMIGGTAAGAGNVISGNAGNGISMNGSNNNVVEGNYIGTVAAGNTAIANGGDGLDLLNSANNTIGGPGGATRNLISGNAGDGVQISGTGSTGNQVAGNDIGTNPSVSAAVANQGSGVAVDSGASNNVVGGSATGTADYISGNIGYGILVTGGTTSGNQILGNIIGLNGGTNTAIGNGLDGVQINGATGTVIGAPYGNPIGGGNIISGNTGYGVSLVNGASGTVLLDEWIGVDDSGGTAVANGSGGVLVLNSGNNTIGGTAGGDGNTISGNAGVGLEISGAGSTGNLVAGNEIGTNAGGTTNVGAQSDGIMIDSGASNNTIGGTTASAQNMVAGSLYAGVYLNGRSTTGNAIEGNNIGTNANGVVDAAMGNTIGGVAAGAGNLISGNTQDGILLAGSGDIVAGNLIGTNAAGTAALGNGMDGILITGTDNTIGGSTAGSRNVISGNSQSGVEISGASATGNTILGNYIGTNAAGTAAIANLADGVLVDNDASGNTIGGTAIGAGNVISGNASNGIEIDGTVSGTVIQGNTIGLNAAGSAAIANAFQGIDIRGANNTVGGAVAGARNIISGNGGNGVLIDTAAANANVIQANDIGTDATGTVGLGNGTSGVFIQGGTATSVVGNLLSGNVASGVGIYSSSTSGNLVQGNQIGTNAAGTGAIANANGVNIDGSAGNQIGGTGTSQGNLISGNTGSGVLMQNSGAANNLLEGNLIGTTITGLVALANVCGVVIQASATNNTIGGSAPGAENVISGNSSDGIEIISGTNTVQGNLIGTTQSGTAALGNGADGVGISGGSGNTVGGTSAGDGNVIAGNSQNGVNINGPSTSGNLVAGNDIGTNASGYGALGNVNGITISGSASNTVGGTAPAARNVIAASSGQGIAILNAGATGNVVEGNYIGTDISGTTALGNDLGVFINGASNNTIGGAAVGALNVISGNQVGIDIFGSSSTSNSVEGNWIGTSANGNAALANQSGVLLVAGAANNVVGGTTIGDGNVIAGNSSDGIYINDGSSGNSIQGNQIGVDASGAALGNNVGVEIDGSTANVLQNNLIGGTTAAARNTISGNATEGVLIGGGDAISNTVAGNFIGVNSAGTAALANGGPGVLVDNSANGNIIGGTAAGAGNLIAYNAGAGVAISGATTTGDAVLGNQIFSNTGIGIDLNNDGITLNHSGGIVVGPNGLQNFPVLLSVSTSGGNTTFTGSFNSSANTTYRIEFFDNAGNGDSSGYGQGALYLGAASVTTDASGNATFSTTLAVTTSNGDAISATATVDLGSGNYGSTSEFSQNLAVGAVDQAPVNTVPGTQTINENASLVFSAANGNQISVTDGDSRGYPEQVTLAVLDGTLTLSGTTGLTFSAGTGSGDASMQFTGTLAAINNALNGLTYTPTANFSGTDGLGITTNDLGNTGVGGPLSTTSSVGIVVNHIDIAPVNTVPGAQTTNDNSTLVFSSAGSNVISVSDSDSGGNAEQIALSVVSGTLNLNGTAGLTFTSGSNGSASLTVQGSLVNINAALDGLTYTPPSNLTYDSNDTLTVVSNDLGNTGVGGPLTDGSTVAITLNHVDRAPVNTIPGVQSVNDNTSLVFSSGTGNKIAVADGDSNGGVEQVSISVGSGTLTLKGTTGLTFTAGSNASTAMTVQGTLANLNTAINGLTYTPPTNLTNSSSTVLNLSTNDLGNTGSGGPLITNSSVAITIDHVDLAPVNTVPSAQGVNDNTTLVFNSVRGNAISVADGDSNGNVEQVSVSVVSGTLSLGDTTGLTFTAGSNGSAAMTIRGTLANINAGLNGLTYTPPANLTNNSSDTLTLVSNDLGNTGSGGPLTASSTVALALNHVDRPPVNTVPGSQVTQENTSLSFSGLNGNQISVADSDSRGNTEQVSLSVTNGKLSLGGTTGLTFTAGADGTVSMTVRGTLANLDTALNGLTYSPAANYVGSDTLRLVTNDLGNTGLGGPTTATSAIGITVAGGVPTISVPGPQQSQSVGFTFSSATGNPITVGLTNGGNGLVQVSLTAANGTMTLAGTAGLHFSPGSGPTGATVVITGSVSAVNSALNGLVFVASGLSSSLQVAVTNPSAGVAIPSAVSVVSITQVPLIPTPTPAPTPTPHLPQPLVPTVPGVIGPEYHASGITTPNASRTDAANVDLTGRGIYGTVQFVSMTPVSVPHTSSRPPEPEHFAANVVNLAARLPNVLQSKIANESHLVWDEINALVREFRPEGEPGSMTVGAATCIGAVLSAGYVVWCLRAGTFIAGALSALPAWMSFDPLPVLEFWEKEHADKRTRDQDSNRSPGLDAEDEGLQNVLA